MRISRFIPYVMLSAILFSCKPKVPGKYLQPDEFEDILYDYHMADAMANGDENANNTSYNVVLYRQAVLRKYGISQAEFDSSLVYYMRHADRLHKIYENLTKRFEDDAMALGASANDIRRYGDMTSGRDTSNIWRGVPAAMLMTQAPDNVMTFDIVADSTYHKGDKLIFSFNCDFIYKDGPKEAIALLAVQFKNDSIASNTVRMSSNSNYSVTVSDISNKGIKAIKGFIYLHDRKSDRETTVNSLRLMFVDNIRLVRLRSTGTPASVQTAPLPNQIRRDTSIKKPVPTNNIINKTHESNKQQPAERRLMPVQGSVKPMKMSEIKPVSAPKEINKKK